MVSKRTADALEMLRQSNPRNNPGFSDLLSEHDGIKEQIKADGWVEAGSSAEARPALTSSGSRATHSSARPRRRTLGLSATALVVVAAGVVAAFMLLGGGNADLTVTPALAAEAVKKAAVDTSAAAESGTIDTVLLIDGEAQVANTVSWNGDDLSLVVQNDEQRQLRYVDGLYYETYGYSVGVAPGDKAHLGEWIHCTDYDNGGGGTPGVRANEEANPTQWLAAARTDLAGSGLVALVTGASGYTQSANADGSTTYAGTTTVAAIESQDWSLNGLPMASQPSFKVLDTSTPVAMRVTVGAEGLIRELKLDWTLDLPGEASVWSYKSTYSELGSAPAIEAPQPDHTVTTDSRVPDSVEGPM
jgi:hypothetical protein